MFMASYSTRIHIIIEAWTNIGRTLFVCTVLSMASIYFMKDSQNLVVDPLERMIEKVKLMSSNPLAAATEEINEAGIFTFMGGGEQKKQREIAEKFGYETVILEKAIIKIGHLLALGFGEAGSRIISQNLTNVGELNPMIPGHKTYCIFGFCIIDDFVETTEILQQDILSYVNKIAEITHSVVDRYGGSANKNIGDAFLLVWKFHDPDEIGAMDEAKNFNNKDICKEN